METHEMKLFEKSFEKIKNKQKDIEVRLFDEKRRLIKLGDKIKFRKLPNLNEDILIEVVGLSVFPTFRDLFLNFSSERFGHGGLGIDEQISRVYEIYDKQAETKNSVVGIHLKLI